MNRIYTAIRNAKGFHCDLYDDEIPTHAEVFMVYSVLEQLKLIEGIDNIEDFGPAERDLSECGNRCDDSCEDCTCGSEDADDE